MNRLTKASFCRRARHCELEQRAMRVLVVHESYQQRGGEDAVAKAEAEQLELHGHTVLRYARHNDELKGKNSLQIIGAGLGTVWATRSFEDLERLMLNGKPDI